MYFPITHQMTTIDISKRERFQRTNFGKMFGYNLESVSIINKDDVEFYLLVIEDISSWLRSLYQQILEWQRDNPTKSKIDDNNIRNQMEEYIIENEKQLYENNILYEDVLDEFLEGVLKVVNNVNRRLKLSQEILQTAEMKIQKSFERTQKAKEEVKCSCGDTYTRSHRARHEKTKRHLELLRVVSIRS
jgi:hypothetical protein